MSTFYTKSHQEKNIWAHQSDARWGGNSTYHFSFLNKPTFSLDSIVESIKPSSILDYGCGKGLALNQLKLKFPNIDMVNYDPFVSSHSVLPDKPCDLVICYNVLQIVELKFLDQIIEQIHSLSTKNILLSMNFNRYCEQTTTDWWRERLSRYNIVVDGKLEDHWIYPISGNPKIESGYNCWISKS